MDYLHRTEEAVNRESDAASVEFPHGTNGNAPQVATKPDRRKSKSSFGDPFGSDAYHYIDLTALMVPMSMATEERISQPRVSVPEKALLIAMLSNAVEEFLKVGDLWARRQTEAEEYIFADEEEWPYAFVNICGYLNLEPEWVRKELRKARVRVTAERTNRWRRQVVA